VSDTNGVFDAGITSTFEKFLAFPSSTAPVPEPSTWAMLLIGFAGLGFVGYQARRSGNAAAARSLNNICIE
jgi:PEP-CTERM motif